MDPLEALHASVDLAGGSAETLDELASSMVHVRFPARAVVFREGDPPGPLYLIHRGRVWLTMSLPDGSSHFVAEMDAGTLIGDMTGVIDHPRTVTATAISTVDAWRLEAAAFRAALRSDRRLAYELYLRAAELVVAKDLRIARRVGQSTPRRVASALLELGRGGEVPLSHAELAMMVGATRESVTRTLTKLRRLGAIETRRKGIVVLDPDVLSAMASEANGHE